MAIMYKMAINVVLKTSHSIHTFAVLHFPELIIASTIAMFLFAIVSVVLMPVQTLSLFLPAGWVVRFIAGASSRLQFNIRCVNDVFLKVAILGARAHGGPPRVGIVYAFNVACFTRFGID